MSRSRYKVFEHHYPYFVTCTVVNRMPLFSYKNFVNILTDTLLYLHQNHSLIIIAYVIMPDHVHLILKHNDLPSAMRIFKSFTARQIIDQLKNKSTSWILKQLNSVHHSSHQHCSYQLWQEGYHPKQLTSDEMIYQKVDYIHYNPVKAGFVFTPDQWRYSSAINYEGGTGFMPVKVYTGFD